KDQTHKHDALIFAKNNPPVHHKSPPMKTLNPHRELLDFCPPVHFHYPFQAAMPPLSIMTNTDRLRRHPLWRRREFDPGSYEKRGNLDSDVKGEPQVGNPHKRESTKYE
ncbi:MAG: hypothetical protein COX51_07530, partial [Syntrophobacteraceae bacterium CG23_combo_of_CG06-09_8_20_14_all_50_8]